MQKRSYELFTLDMHSLSIFGAWQYKNNGKALDKYCAFTYEQTMILPLSQKGNTILFEQLSEVIGLPYSLSDNLFDCFLYDVMFVDCKLEEDEKQVCFINDENSSALCMDSSEAREWLYMNGFYITGVPKRNDSRNRPYKTDGIATEAVHFRPFVSSASMARKGIMLFVNEKYYAELMRRLTLGFFDYNTDSHHLYMPTTFDSEHPDNPFFGSKYRVSPSKMSAYLGLMLSDGVTLREKQFLWTQDRCDPAPILPVLNEKTVFVADDLELDAKQFYEQKGPYVWCIEPELKQQACVSEKEGLLETFFQLLDKNIYDDSIWDTVDLCSTLELWKQTVIEYIKEEMPIYSGELPWIDEGLSTGQFAYIWACAFLFKYGCNQFDNAQAAIENCIDEIEKTTVARHTLFNLIQRRSSGFLTISGLDDKKKTLKKTKELSLQCGGKDYFICFEENTAKTFRCRLKPINELENNKESINLFDGMGLCDNETFDLLEQLLLQKPINEKRPENRRYSALIIRLPWLKGVIVRCDFQRFFADQANGTNQPIRTSIQDVFGKKRELQDIHFIINKSMLKGYKYLKNLVWEGKEKSEYDPWKYYWQKINEYGISLLVAGRHSKESERVKLNYQFISTMELKDAGLEQIIERNALVQRNALYLDERTIKDFFLKQLKEKNKIILSEEDQNETVDADQIEQQEYDYDTIDTDTVFGRALQANSELLKTRYAKTATQSYGRSELLNSMRGRIEVDGDYRLIAPDLLAMLFYLYDRYVSGCYESGSKFPSQTYKLKSLINFPQDEPFRGHGFYYAPGKKTPWATKSGDSDIVALRNPHYALGEGAVVSPLPPDLKKDYNRYLGHLTSVVMLPATAVASMGGADYDGDRAAVVSESSIVNSIKAAINKNQIYLSRLLLNREMYKDRFKSLNDGSEKMLNFARDLLAWMINSLPDADISETNWREGYGIPLIFGDSKSLSIDFSCREPNMEKFLWNSFLLTTQQRIGELSVEALKYASVAYQIGPTIAFSSDNKDFSNILSQEDIHVIRDCMWHWRMVSLSLENGAEIDMAKTGIKCWSAPLREAQSFSDIDKEKSPDARDMFEIEDTPDSLMRKYDMLQRKSDIHKATGNKLTKEMKSILRDKDLKLEYHSNRLKAEQHNVVNLIPEMCYRAATQSSDSETGSKTLPFPNLSGRSLQDFLLKPKRKKGKNDDPEEPNPEGSMRKLAWAKNKERAEKLGEYIASQCALQDDQKTSLIECLRERKELTGSEQGVYFFKELLKYQYNATRSTIDAELLQDDVPKTPGALRQMLLQNAAGNKEMLMRFLCSCDSKHFDIKKQKWFNDMNDYLFLMLAGEDFVEACGRRVKYDLLPIDDPLLKEGKRLVSLYQRYKTQTGRQAEATDEMRKRYVYCLKNLLNRYSLTKSLGIMKGYCQSYVQTPLASYINPRNLKKLYVFLEDRKNEEDAE